MENKSKKLWWFEFTIIWSIIVIIFIFSIFSNLPMWLLWWTGVFCYLGFKFWLNKRFN